MFPNLLPTQPAHVQVPLDVSSSIDAAKLKVHVPDKAPITAEIKTTADGRHLLDINWQGDEAIGWHRYQLDVKVGDAPNAVTSPFQFAVEVVPEVDIFPSSLMVREDELATGWSRRVTIEFRKKFAGHPSILWSDPQWRESIQVKTEHENAEKLVLSLAQSAAQAKAVLPGKRAQLLLRFPEGPVCTLPIVLGEVGLEKTSPPPTLENKDKMK